MDIEFDHNNRASENNPTDFKRRILTGHNIPCHLIQVHGVFYAFLADHFLQKNTSSLPKVSIRAITDTDYIAELMIMAKMITEQEPTTHNVDDIILKNGKRAGPEKKGLSHDECLNLSLSLPASDNYSLREAHI